jgi:hypothetical protein
MNASLLKKSLTALALSAVLVGCNGGGGGGSSYGPKTSPYISAQGFVNALNSVDGAPFPFDSYIVKDQWDTVRNDQTWFVIYDSEYNEHVAVSLQYLRSIVYFAHYSSNNALANEFRAIQSDDQFFYGIIGDGFGYNYEIVDYSHTDIWGESYYIGYDSGLLYEDQGSSFDVSLMAGEQENIEFYQKAANVSYAYNVGIEASLALVALGQRVERMVGTSSEITLADQAAVMNDIAGIAGVSLADINKASMDQRARQEMIEDIADRIGTSASNLEQRILPELLGLEL